MRSQGTSETAPTPTGTSITSVNRDSSTQTTLTLTYDGTDFDSNASMTVTVNQSGLASDTTGPATTSAVTVTAFFEAVAAISTTTPSTLTESNLNGATMVITLSEGNYDSSLDAEDFGLNSAPTSTSITSVNRDSATQATLTLTYDGTDFDANASTTVTVNQSGLASDTLGPATTSAVTVTAFFEAVAAISTTTPSTLTESNLNGATLVITLSEGNYDSSLVTGDFGLNSAPTGTSITSVNRDSSTQATLTLTYDGTDFDSDASMSVTVNQAGLASDTTGPATTSAVTVSAFFEAVAAISTTTPSTLTESNLNGATMVITLSEGNYDASLATGDFGLNSAPTGTSISSVNRDSATQATLTLAFDGTDFDANASTTVTVNQSGFASDTLGPATTSAVTVTAFFEAAPSISTTTPSTLTESNLNDATVVITLSEGSYDSSLATGDFGLNGAPTGTSISSVNRDSSTQATLTLSYDNTDFDTNASTTVTVNQSGLASDTTGPATTSAITITAVLEVDVSISTTTPASLTESNLNGATLVVTLGDGTFEASLATGDFSLNSAPTGTSITSVSRDSATQATLTLAFDGTDFDSDASMSVTVGQSALATGTGPATTGSVTVTAFFEAVATISTTTPSNLTESNLNGATLVVTLSEGSYNSSLATSTDFTLNSAPTGTSISSVNRDSATQATLTLAFDGTDFDANASTTVTVNQSGFASDSLGPATTSSVTVSAFFEAVAIISTTTPASLSESNLNGATLVVTLSEGSYDGTLSTSTDFTLNGTPTGTSITSVSRNSAIQATLTLAFDGTDFDANASTTVTVNQAGLASNTLGPATTSSVTVTALFEAVAVISTTTPLSLTESNLNGATLVVTLSEGNYDSTLSTSTDFTLNGAPAGTSLSSVNRDSVTQATLTLAFDGTDFDANGSMSVTVNQSALAINTTGPATTSAVTVTALFEAVAVISTTTPLSLTESNLNGATMVVTLSEGNYDSTLSTSTDFTLNGAPTGTSISSVNRNLNGATLVITLSEGKYDASLTTGDFVLNGAPAGTSISSVNRDSATQATLTLAFNGADFDANASMSVTVNQGGLTSNTTGPATTSTVTVSAIIEAGAAISTTTPPA